MPDRLAWARDSGQARGIERRKIFWDDKDRKEPEVGDRKTEVPRHNEVVDELARKICKDLRSPIKKRGVTEAKASFGYLAIKAMGYSGREVGQLLGEDFLGIVF